MIVGIGIDIADNSRFAALEIGMKKKIITQWEIAMSKEAFSESEYLSSRFAAKEAFSKALGSGFCGISPKDIETMNDSKGKPFIKLLKDFGFNHKIHLSISHEREMSVAMVVLEDVTL